MSSHWASRGWTFQECCLAGRRLIFTADQTLFLCNRSMVAESVKPRIVRDQYLHFDFAHLISRPTMQGDTSTHFLEQVQEYSGRNISYDSDSLNAFLGVLHQWETRLARTKKPMSHLWGLPIRGTTTHGPGSVNFYFLWRHDFRDAVRRPDFPSWSWAGWAGRKHFFKFPIHLAGSKQEQDKFRVHISVQSDDQKTQQLADFHKDSVVRIQKSRHYRPGPTCLLVTCASFPVKLQDFQLSQVQKSVKTELYLSNTRVLKGRPKNGNLFLFHIFENVQVGIEGFLDQDIQPNDRLSGLLLHQPKISDHQPKIANLFLVVKHVEEATYERVGLVHWHPKWDMLFLNREGCILDRVDLPGKKLFPAGFERRTMCLV